MVLKLWADSGVSRLEDADLRTFPTAPGRQRNANHRKTLDHPRPHPPSHKGHTAPQ